MTPNDIENVKLTRSFRGYATTEVDKLLADAAAALEKLLTENVALREETDRVRAELEMLRRDEKFVQEAIITAQKTADEIRMAAQKHADLIVEEGRQSAQAERNASQQKLSEIKWEYERVRQDRQRFLDDFRVLLERHQRELTTPPPLQVMEGASA
jgi:cell division initiation protein